MHVYIANCTRQNWTYYYRLPEMHQNAHISIPSGNQERLGDRMSPNQFNALLEDLQRWGVKDFKDLKGKVEDFSGLLFSVDKPIKEDHFHIGLDKVIESANQRAVEEVQKAALGLDRVNRDKKSGRRLVKEVTTEITGDAVVNSKSTGNDAHFQMSVSEDGMDKPKIRGLK